MKKYFYLIFLFGITLSLASCNSIEDSSDFDKVGTSITPDALKEALSFTQLPNVDNQVIGDQYVIVKNNRKDIGGAWHLVYNGSEKTYNEPV